MHAATSHTDPDELLNEVQARLSFLKMSIRTLQAWRCRGEGPAFVRPPAGPSVTVEATSSAGSRPTACVIDDLGRPDLRRAAANEAKQKMLATTEHLCLRPLPSCHKST